MKKSTSQDKIWDVPLGQWEIVPNLNEIWNVVKIEGLLFKTFISKRKNIFEVKFL